MSDPNVAWLLAVAAQYQANNGLDTVTPEVISAIVAAAGSDTALASKAIIALMGL